MLLFWLDAKLNIIHELLQIHIILCEITYKNYIYLLKFCIIYVTHISATQSTYDCALGLNKMKTHFSTPSIR